MKFFISLKDIGREKVSREYEVILDSMDKAEDFALQASSQYLKSKDISLCKLDLIEDRMCYSVIVGGFRKVGSVFITTELVEENKIDLLMNVERNIKYDI